MKWLEEKGRKDVEWWRLKQRKCGCGAPRLPTHHPNTTLNATILAIEPNHGLLSHEFSVSVLPSRSLHHLDFLHILCRLSRANPSFEFAMDSLS